MKTQQKTKIFLPERIVYLLNTVQCYNILEIYCCYELQKHKALCEFVIEKGLLLVKGKPAPPPDTYKRE
jgi:hypothetical protein